MESTMNINRLIADLIEVEADERLRSMAEGYRKHVPVYKCDEELLEIIEGYFNAQKIAPSLCETKAIVDRPNGGISSLEFQYDVFDVEATVSVIIDSSGPTPAEYICDVQKIKITLCEGVI